MKPAQELKESYNTLGIEPGAPLDEVKTAYHRLARTLHPDLNPGAIHTHMASLNAAYQKLCQHLRQDASPNDPLAFSLREWARAAAKKVCARARHTAAQAAYGDAQPVAKSTDQKAKRPKGEICLAGPLPLVGDQPAGWRLTGLEKRSGRLIYLVEVTGRPRSITLPVRRVCTCSHCQGSGIQEAGGRRHTCPGCGGSGRITRADRVRLPIPSNWRPGQIIEAPVVAGQSSILVELRS